MKQESKQCLYKIVKRIDDCLRFDEDVMNLISSLWNVYQKTATGEDSRYSILGDEIVKHYFMNDDWPQDKLYLSILHILDDEQILLKYVEGIANLAGLASNDSVINDLTNILISENYELASDNGKWIIRPGAEGIVFEEDRQIPFVRCKSTVTNYFLFEEKDVQYPEDKECFVLTFNYLWNDYSYCTWFRLYYKKGEDIAFIGRVKIMKLSEVNTDEVLENRFYRLDEQYCSLGCDVDYY